MENIEILKNIDIFSAVPVEELIKIANLVTTKTFKAGEAVFIIGEIPDAIYAVKGGYVATMIELESEKKTIRSFSEGEIFGETSVLTKEPHCATARAETNAELLIIPINIFLDILNKFPKASAALIKTLSERLRSVDRFSRRKAGAHIISVCSASEGLGKTTLAVNLAAAIRKQTKNEVIVIDLNDYHKNPFSMLNLNPVDSKYDGSAASLDALIVRHDSGINVLDGFRLLNDFYAIFEILKLKFKYLIFDLPTKGLPVENDILASSNTILIISADEDGVKSKTKIFIDSLKKIKLHTKATLRLGINLAFGDGKPKKSVVERDLGLKIDFILASNTDIAKKSLATGIPFVASDPESDISRDITSLATKLTKRRVGLALSAGAAQGLAHIGVFKVLQEENIPIDIIAGTSGGSLYGSGFAAGFSAEKLQRIVMSKGSRGFMSIADFTFPKSGLMEGRHITKLVKSFIGNMKFSDLKIPMMVIATDLMSGSEVTITKGLLHEAIRASISIPGIFIPIEHKGRYLIDGSSSTPIPIEPLNNAGADFIIAVSVTSYGSSEIAQDEIDGLSLEYSSDMGKQLQRRIDGMFKLPGIFDIIMRSREISSNKIVEMSCGKADVVIRPKTGIFGWMDYKRAPEIIKAGEIAAREAMPTIKKIINL